MFGTTRGQICGFYSDRKNCKIFNSIVHQRLWTKVQKIFYTCKTHKFVNLKSLTWVTAENFERIAKKPVIFTLVHVKALTVFTNRDQRSGRVL